MIFTSFLVYLLAVPLSMALCDTKTSDGVCFGHELKEKHFLLAENFINLNHGSFGTIPKVVAEAQRKLVLEQGSFWVIFAQVVPIYLSDTLWTESYPDTWFRESYYDYIDKSRELIASFVNATLDGLVLVENASSAVNSILRSLGLSVSV